MNRRHGAAVETPTALTAVVLAHDRGVHRRALDDPFLVLPGLEDVAGLLDTLQDLLVRPAPYALRRQQPGTPRSSGRDHLARHLVPVADEVRFFGNVAAPRLEQGVDVRVPQ